MYMSRLRLDGQRRETMRALAEPKLFHGAIERGFDGPRQRNLWRIDRLGDAYYLLVVSPTKPDLSAAARQFGFAGSDLAWETQDYTKLLERVQAGTRWRFRLTANPVRHAAAQGQRGKVQAHVTPEQQAKWLMAQAEKHGFSLQEDDFGVTGSRFYRFDKPGGDAHRVSLSAVTFEGMLTVTEAELLRKALTEGIGRGKAYGLGMLTIAR